jgi:hypothetical protein
MLKLKHSESGHNLKSTLLLPTQFFHQKVLRTDNIDAEKLSVYIRKLVKNNEQLVKIDQKYVKIDQKLVKFDEKLVIFDDKLVTFDEKLVTFDEKLAKFDEKLVYLGTFALPTWWPRYQSASRMFMMITKRCSISHMTNLMAHQFWKDGFNAKKEKK